MFPMFVKLVKVNEGRKGETPGMDMSYNDLEFDFQIEGAFLKLLPPPSPKFIFIPNMKSAVLVSTYRLLPYLE